MIILETGIKEGLAPFKHTCINGEHTDRKPPFWFIIVMNSEIRVGWYTVNSKECCPICNKNLPIFCDTEEIAIITSNEINDEKREVDINNFPCYQIMYD